MKKYLVCLAVVAIWPLFADVVTGPTPQYVPPPNQRGYYDNNYYRNPGVPYRYDYNQYNNPYGGYGHGQGYYQNRPYYNHPHNYNNYNGNGNYYNGNGGCNR